MTGVLKDGLADVQRELGELRAQLFQAQNAIAGIQQKRSPLVTGAIGATAGAVLALATTLYAVPENPNCVMAPFEVVDSAGQVIFEVLPSGDVYYHVRKPRGGLAIFNSGGAMVTG
jgi:hypothetical protein